MSQQVEAFRRIPVAQLVFSQTTAQKERRAHFDKVALEELVKSVKAVGVTQPILVRPIAGAETFEVCAGERRVLATKGAGLDDVPAMVRDITDEQLLELQLIENLQREGLHELAEAEGYEQLMKKHGYDADAIAAKVSKSRSYVYGRLRLTALCPEARIAFYDGKLSASTALDLARIPVVQLQKQALKEITAPKYGDPLSVRQAREHIHDNYMLRLAGACFATEDAGLVPKAGACGACPKRTGNQPELFGDVKGTDVCTDPVCFKSKIRAHADRAIAAAQKSGQVVITGKEAKRVAPHGADGWLEDYVQLSNKNYSDPKQRTYAEILGKDYVPTLLHDEETGELIKIAPREDLPKPATGKTTISTSRSSASKKEDAAKQAKYELETKYAWELMKRVYEKAPKVAEPRLLANICGHLSDRLGDEDLKEISRIAGFKLDYLSTKTLEKLSAADLSRLAFVMDLADRTSLRGVCGKELLTVAKQLKIDPKKVRAEMLAASKAAGAPAKTATTASAGAKKKAAKKK